MGWRARVSRTQTSAIVYMSLASRFQAARIGYESPKHSFIQTRTFFTCVTVYLWSLFVTRKNLNLLDGWIVHSIVLYPLAVV